MRNFIRYLVCGSLLLAVAFAAPTAYATAPRSANVEFSFLPLHTMEIPRYVLPVYREVTSYPQPVDIPNSRITSRSLQNFWPAFGSQRIL